MSKDPFLAAHQIGPLRYDISAAIDPISVRDQMIRARMLVDRIMSRHEVPDGGHILVIGAGAAGASAAVRIAQWGTRYGVQALLHDAKHSFRLFGGCSTRRIDPTFYGWPLPFWKEGCFPLGMDAVDTRTGQAAEPQDRLAWTANTGVEVAQGWREFLLNPGDLRPYLTLRENGGRVVQIKDPIQDPHWKIPVIFESGLEEKYELVIRATGAGKERTWAKDIDGKHRDGDYWGPRFWNNDPACTADMGMPARPARVLISGGGDGALQDFIRLVTGLHVSEAFYHLNACLEGLSVWADAQAQIQEAEDHDQRTYIWRSRLPAGHDLHAVYERAEDAACTQLQVTHTLAALSLIEDREAYARIVSLFGTWIGARHLPDEIILVFPGETFPHCFAANRLFATLLERYLATVYSRTILFPCTKVEKVECLGHLPPNPNEEVRDVHPCWGKEHRVTFDQPVRSGVERYFDLVILRHGIWLSREEREILPDNRISRQLIPYRQDHSFWRANDGM